MDLWGNEDAEEYRARIRAEFLGEAYHFPDYEALEKAIHGCRRCPLRSEGGLSLIHIYFPTGTAA